jgi:hypothetical protein
MGTEVGWMVESVLMSLPFLGPETKNGTPPVDWLADEGGRDAG